LQIQARASNHIPRERVGITAMRRDLNWAWVV
jgi:hypothetical protein